MEGFPRATNNWLLTYTFTTARNRAEREQTVYIKKGGEKKKTQPQKNTSWVFFFFQETHLVSNPSHTTLIRHGMAYPETCTQKLVFPKRLFRFYRFQN